MRIAVLGAGHVGRTIASFLAQTRDYDVTVFDQNQDALKGLVDENISARVQDTTAEAEIASAIRGHDAVINALPFHLAPTVAAAALAERTHYFDLTEDVSATRFIRDLADQASTAFIPQCGLAPGFIGIVARHVAARFDQVYDIKMRVGALPVFPTNTIKYNLTWSVDGLINEYCHPCQAIREGEPVELMPLEGLEHFSLDGVEYEAFNTSGGLGTLCETMAGQVSSLDYKSVRYPGHCSAMRFLLDELRLKFDRETLTRILRESIPTTEHDVVIVFVAVSGMKDGTYIQEVFTRKIFGGEELGGSAIQVSTASGLCAVVDLFRLGKLPERGFVRQEDISLRDFLANRFARVYKEADQIHSAN